MGYFDETYPLIVAEIDKEERTFFKTFQDRIVIGKRNGEKRWILEGRYRAGQSQVRRCYSSSSEIKFTEVNITEVIALDGTIAFDATPLKVDGQNLYLIVRILPWLNSSVEAMQIHFKQDIRDLHILHVSMHEMNHILTAELLTETGELNNFKSELLADIFLIHELNAYPNRELHLALKHFNVRDLLSNKRWTSDNAYYELYLKVIERLLSLPTQDDIAAQSERLKGLLANNWSGTLHDLFTHLMSSFGNGDR